MKTCRRRCNIVRNKAAEVGGYGFLRRPVLSDVLKDCPLASWLRRRFPALKNYRITANKNVRAKRHADNNYRDSFSLAVGTYRRGGLVLANGVRAFRKGQLYRIPQGMPHWVKGVNYMVLINLLDGKRAISMRWISDCWK